MNDDPLATKPKSPYTERRVQEQQDWHSQKAAWNRRRYYACEIATLLAGTLIPVVNVVWTAKDSWVAQVLSAVLGAMVTIATGIAKLFKFQENWLQYRSIAEALGRERELYLGNAGDYGASGANREPLLVERVEALLSESTSKFIATQQAKFIAAQQAKAEGGGGVTAGTVPMSEESAAQQAKAEGGGKEPGGGH